MAIDELDAVKESFLDDVFASADLSVRMPKFKFPKESTTRATSISRCTTS